MTLLTIIIPNYNHGHFLKECIESICHGVSVDDIEILIVDDHSNDNSLQIIKNLSYPITLHCHQQNRGVVAALNSGLKQARGAYVHLFAADDLYLPGTLDSILNLIKKNPEVALFSSDCGSKSLPLNSYRFFTPQQVHTLFRHTDFWIPGQTVIAKKKIYSQYAPLDEKLGATSDWYVNHTIALNHGIGYTPKTLISRREDPLSYSSRTSLIQKKAMWQHLLSLQNNKLAQSGICRMLGLKAIYRYLPLHWNYALPIISKELEKQLFKIIKIDRNAFWIDRLK